MVLGNNDAHILPQTDMVFGGEMPSVYASTPRGIMLMGSVSRMKDNIAKLPNLKMIRSCEVNAYVTTAELHPNTDEVCNETYHASYDDNGDVDEKMLTEATEAILKQSYFHNNQYIDTDDEKINESDARMVKYVLDNTRRTDEGRLVMPLLWKDEVAHLLASNLNLSEKVLKSNLKRLKNNPVRLQMYDQVIKEQVELGIVEQVPDLSQFLTECPTSSFLPHMGVFRLDRETTKC